ncbi:MAG: amino acid--[acyl-carrier-protein] ligase [Pseudomonadales bacterium]
MSGSSAEQVLGAAMIDAGYWLETGLPGIYGRTGQFEEVVNGFDHLVEQLAKRDGAEVMRFPPVMPSAVLLRAEYMQSFPELCGCVHSYAGGEAGHAELLEAIDSGKAWGMHLTQTDLALSPAACYPLYPTLRGTLPAGGRLVSLSSFVFRREPSTDPARLQSFLMRENVRLDTAEAVSQWREEWMARGMSLLKGLQLPVTLEVANDPFFGRGGKMLRANQRADGRKFEICLPIAADRPTALASFNYHADKFGRTFDIRTEDGEPAHTACIGFGLERVAIGLLHTHGLDRSSWPREVREILGLRVAQ